MFTTAMYVSDELVSHIKEHNNYIKKKLIHTITFAQSPCLKG